MANFFITKKQKKLIKERRRKKKLIESGQLVPGDTAATVTTNSSQNKDAEQERQPLSNAKKRPRPADVGTQNPDEPAHEQNSSSNKKAPSAASTTKPEIVVVPANLSAKEAKKFRKNARRQARSAGRDDSRIQFVLEGEALPERKKPKRSFPCINALLKEEKLQQEQRDKIQKEDDLPDDYKSQFVALDCEMVGIGTDGKQSALARVSLVDWWGKTLLDTFVQVPTKVTDFRTFVSGVQPKHLQSSKAMDVKECRDTVAQLLKDKILVGHALKNDLHALMLQHPRDRIRDTARYRPFQRFHKKWRARKLRDLVREHCGLTIQVEGESHDSVDDAAATMELYKTVQAEWEKELQLKATKQKKSKQR